MPERSETTDDFEALVRGVVDEVETRGTRPGAGQAVRTAARRRVAGAGTLVVVLVVLGGLAGWLLPGSQRAGVPVAGGPSPTAGAASSSSSFSDPGVPPPARITADTLSTASGRWATWQTDAGARTAVPGCLTQATRPDGATTDRFTDGASGGASLERLTFASRDDSDRAMLATVQSFLTCPQDAGQLNLDVRADLEVVAFRWRSGGREGLVWLVNFEDRMDVLTVGGTSRPSDDTVDAIGRLLAGDVQVP